jgi:putrescine transport system substrate-binding protein
MAGHSGYDIVSTTTGFYGHQIQSGRLSAHRQAASCPTWNNIDPRCSRFRRQVDPGNRYAVPYLHAMNGIVYNVD